MPLQRTQLEPLIEDGLSQREIAAELGVSQGTVKHWLGRYELHTKPKRVEQSRARTQTCPRHKDSTFVKDTAGRWRCRACRVDSLRQARQRLRQDLIDAKGGRCIGCGYDRIPEILQFHHRDPTTKLYDVSRLCMGVRRKLALVEVEKCDLVCPTCHAEIEWKITHGSLADVDLAPL